jgi:hypothetical protein
VRNQFITQWRAEHTEDERSDADLTFELGGELLGMQNLCKGASRRLLRNHRLAGVDGIRRGPR